EPGELLNRPWREMTQEQRDVWLWGTGDQHITFTWRKGSAPLKHGGEFRGIIPYLLSTYGSTGSKMQRRQLEKYMSVVRCPDCQGDRLNPQARNVRLATAHPRFGSAAA